MLRMSSIVFCIGLLVMVPALHAQEERRPIVFGPSIGGEVAVDRAQVPVYGNSPDCGVYSSGTGLAPWVGGNVLIPAPLGEAWAFDATFGCAYAVNTLVTTPVEPTRIISSGRLVTLDRELELQARRWRLSMDLLLQRRLTGRLSIGLGPCIAVNAGAEFTQTDRVLGPGGFGFTGGGQEQSVRNASDITSAALAFGPMVKMAYDIPWRGALIQPSLAVRADLSSAAREWSWTGMAFVGRVALLFGGASSEPASVPVATDSAAPRERPLLTASIQMSGLDANGEPVGVAKVHINETQLRRNVPILSAVFFDAGSARIPDRYIRRDAAAAARFSVDDLASLDLLATQYHVLDVVGSRLAALPKATVMLYGSSSRDEAAGVGLQRASAVARYLQETWKIDPARLQIREGNGTMERSSEATEDGHADNRRVEISATDDAVTAPLVTDQLIHDFDPPLLRLVPSFKAEAGLADWSLKVLHGEKVVAQYTSRDSSTALLPELTWDLASKTNDTSFPPLSAELVVRDATGATVTARGSVPLVLEKHVVVVDGGVVRRGDHVQAIHTLIGFDYDAAALDRGQQVRMPEIVRSIRSGAVVRVIGSADRIGESARNAELARQRAANVAAELRAALDARGVHDVRFVVDTEGAQAERFPNDLQEGRVLSRGVHIVVEQTIEATEK